MAESSLSRALLWRPVLLLVGWVTLTACQGELAPGEESQLLERAVPPAAGALCKAPGAALPAPVPMRRLSRAHVERAVQDVLGVTQTLGVTDEGLLRFRSNISSPIDNSMAQAYLSFAESVVDKAALTACSTPAACQAWLLDNVGRRLFRRPLEGALRARYAALYETARTKEGSTTGGAKWVLQAMLQSPAFLYMDEPLDADGYLDGYGIAGRLALAFWSSVPDLALMDAAAQGALDTAEGVRARAQAMLVDKRSTQGLGLFVSQWLSLDKLRERDARPDLFALGETTLAALEREPAEFFQRVVAEQGGLVEILSDSTTATLPALASIYGADIVSSSGGWSQLDPAKRGGIMTLPGVMAALAHAGETSPTRRGYAVLDSLLCDPPGDPPAGTSVSLPPPLPNTTLRQRLEAHFTTPGCAACHKSMDGMGFAFEKFDALGRSRELDEGHPVDDQSDFFLGMDTFSLKGGVALSQVLAHRREVRLCVTKQWLRHAAGTVEPSSMNCWVAALAERLEGNGGWQAMMLDLAASDYLRKGVAP